MEKIYDAPANYNDIINYALTMDTDKLNSSAEKLVIKLMIYKTKVKYYKATVTTMQLLNRFSAAHTPNLATISL